MQRDVPGPFSLLVNSLPKKDPAGPGFLKYRKEMVLMDGDINVLCLVKQDERYVWLYDDASRAEVLRMLGRFASNPDLSFTWYDAAMLSQKIRKGLVERR